MRSIYSEKIVFLKGGVSNLANYRPSIHLRIGGRHKLNTFVCFKANKHTIRTFILLYWSCVLAKSLVYITECLYNMHPTGILIGVVIIMLMYY